MYFYKFVLSLSKNLFIYLKKKIFIFEECLIFAKIFQTTSPSKDVWGDFNEMMGNAVLVN